ncbi:hypothetical protein GCM10009092_11570 [Bowmanella denitrificans]|uniref:Dicarboxylate transport domain-containing protein n=1 Tax=Bowmanella denitrificans TaxID=366582 RepID=A0ABP3GM85_9ALTE
MKTALNVVVWTLLALLVCVAGLWWFRQPLALQLANHYLAPHKVQLSCLQWDLHLQTNLDWQVSARSVCVQGPGFSAEAANALFDLSQLQVASLQLVHQPDNAATHSKENQPVSWQLPDLPAISIDKLQLQSPLLRQPLEMAVRYQQGNLQLNGPWQADIALKDNQAELQLNWRLADLANYLRLPEALPAALLDSPIHTQASFDGQNLVATNQIATQFSYLLEALECQMPIAVTGELALRLDTTMLQADMDLSALPIKLNLQHCPIPNPAAELYKPAQITINLPDIAKVNLQSLKLASAEVQFTGKTQGLLTLNHIDWQTDKPLTASYQLNSILVPAQPSEQWFPLALQGIGQIHLSVDSQVPDYQLSGQEWQLSADSWRVEDWQADKLQLNSQFTLDSKAGLQAELKVKAAQALNKDIRLGAIKTTISLASQDLKNVTGKTDLSLDNLASADGKITGLMHQHQFNVQQGLVTILGNTKLKKLDVQKWQLNELAFKHELFMPLSEPLQGRSVHQWQLPSGLHGQVNQEQNRFNLTLPAQSSNKFTPLLKPLLPQLALTAGQLAASAEYALDTGKLNANIDVSTLSLSYQDYQVEDISVNSDISWYSGNLHLAPATLSIKSVNVGLPITDISAQLGTDAKGPVLSGLNGKLLSGEFSLPQLRLDNKPQQMTLALRHLDAGELAKLGKDSGIEVRGKVGADVPIKLDGKLVEVKDGKLYNEGPAKLLIYDNAAFDSLLASQPNLAPSLSALKNMDISSLTSTVNLKPDGWLLLDMKIKGHNPGKKQDVNFNYTHEENLFTLLRALQLGDEVQKKVQEKVK